MGGRELIWREDDTLRSGLTLSSDDLGDLGAGLTVGAWVHCPGSRAEAMQPLVSKWAPQTGFDAFSAFDAGTTDGLITKGFYGAVFDGQYVYYCPIRSREERTSVHGCVLRYNTHMGFHDPGAYSAHDAGNTDGLHTVGFYGSVFDGRYVYFIPRDDGRVHHSRFLRMPVNTIFRKLDNRESLSRPTSDRDKQCDHWNC